MRVVGLRLARMGMVCKGNTIANTANICLSSSIIHLRYGAGRGDSSMTTLEQPITRSELREELQHYATKEDLRDELGHYATKADIADVRADMARMETRLVKWMVGIMFRAAALSTSMALVIQRL